MPLQIRRGTELQRQAMTVPLASGELLYVTDDQRLYIGNGNALGGVLITGFTTEDAQDAVRDLFDNGTHTGITFTYSDLSNKIDATVDLSSFTGAISAAAFKGSLFADDSSILVDALEGTINLNGTISGHVVPVSNETYDLGTNSYRFRDLYLSGSSIILGNSIITASGSGINLPAGSTIAGLPITDLGIVSGSDYNINIVADDSTTIVNGVDRTVTATGGLFGNLLTENIATDNYTETVPGLVNINIASEEPEVGLKITSLLPIDSGGDVFRIFMHHNETDGNEMTILRTRGTDVAQTSLIAGDEIFNLSFFGKGTVDLSSTASIKVLSDPAGTIGSNIVPGKIEFYTTNDSGITSSKLSIDKDGLIGVAANTLVAGPGSGQVDTSSVSTYLKIKVGSTNYAIPLYAINP